MAGKAGLKSYLALEIVRNVGFKDAEPDAKHLFKQMGKMDLKSLVILNAKTKKVRK